jgi:hypothetical protein
MSGEWEISGTLRGTAFAFGRVIDRVKFAADPHQWAQETLERERKNFEAGNKSSLALAICVCGHMGLPLPAWAAGAWADACNKVFNLEVRSWDHVLKRPTEILKTETRRAKVQKQRALGQRLLDILHADPPQRIDEDLFKVLGRKLSPRDAPNRITKAQAKNLYYSLAEHQRPRPKRKRPPPKPRSQKKAKK